MEVLILLVFLGLLLVLSAFLGFVWTVRNGTLDHTDRLALLPLESESATSTRDGTPCVKAPAASLERPPCKRHA
ncbi:MAG: cbb3-type cytochrome oxidase assembly protein CcoS [Polyangiaceae bacterium]|nr:cbb3-type cytochrome oxidase assembly protein CcoS [Polyangiaceae bacterium]